MVLNLAHLRINTAVVVAGAVRLQVSKWHAISFANSHGGLKNTRSLLRSLSKTESLREQRDKSPCEVKPSSFAQLSKMKSNRACRGSKLESTYFQSIERLVATGLRCLL
jgi:hypothetical protein